MATIARPRLVIGADLWPRVASGVVMAALALGVAVVGGFPFLVFWGLAALGVAWEWQRLVGGPSLGLRVAICFAALLAAAPWAFYAHALLSLLILDMKN